MIAVGLALLLSATLLTSGPVLAKSGTPLNVSLYGTARHVTFDGVDAIQASSACPTGYPTCFGDGSFTYGGVVFRTPKGSSLTFADLATLSTSYYVQSGDCGGGAPRISVFVEAPSGLKAVFLYIGPIPSFTGCSTGTWEDSGNFVGTSEVRVDSTQLGGPFYGTWADAASLANTYSVAYITVDVDGGWASNTGGLQTILFSDITVNGRVYP